MKKIQITVVVIVVLIAAWMGAAWYTGTRIQAQTDDIVARINASLASNQQAMSTQIKLMRYERGLFSSRARFMVTSSVLDNKPLSESDVTFWHGPFPLAALRHGNFLPQRYQAHIEVLATAGPLKMAASALMNGKPPLVVDIGCGYNHHCTGTGSVPPIGADLSAVSNNAKLAFGGIQMQFDFDYRSETDYKINGDAQLLPLTIGNQNFGSVHITIASNAQSATELLSWKTDQGESKLTLTLNAAQPMPLWGSPSLTPEDLPKLIKSASARLDLSKPMAVDLTARVLNLTQDVELATARQQVDAQFTALLTNNPDTAKFIQRQGDLLVSDWQYADDKLIINGQENPELLEQIKQSYLTQLHAQEQALRAGEEAADQLPGDNDGAASVATPASAPSEGTGSNK